MKTPYRMLIIDDNEEILSMFDRYFSSKGYEVVAIENALDGLKLLKKKAKRFDFVITDLVMPNISGIGIISVVKEMFPQTVIIAMTGWGEHPEALAAEAKADAVMEKPVSFQKLDKIVTKMLEKRYKNRRSNYCSYQSQPGR